MAAGERDRAPDAGRGWTTAAAKPPRNAPTGAGQTAPGRPAPGAASRPDGRTDPLRLPAHRRPPAALHLADATDRHIHVGNICAGTVLLGGAATGALVGPVATRRLPTGRRVEPETVIRASRPAVPGLVLLLCTMASSLPLVLRPAVPDPVAESLVGAMAGRFTRCRFALPLWAGHRS
jgi:hypothetical protein